MVMAAQETPEGAGGIEMLFVILIDREVTDRTRLRALVTATAAAEHVEPARFPTATAAAEHVEAMDSLDCLDARDRVFVIVEGDVPPLGWHSKPVDLADLGGVEGE